MKRYQIESLYLEWHEANIRQIEPTNDTITILNPCQLTDPAMSLDRRTVPHDTRVMELTETIPVHLIHVDPDMWRIGFF